MFDRVRKWFRWKSREKGSWVRKHFRSARGERRRKAREGIKPLILEATEEFLIPTEVGKALVTIADKRVAKALQEFRLDQETKGEASRLQMEEVCRRLTEVDDAVKELRAAMVAGAGHVEELNRRLATHAASAADVVEGINTRLAGLRDEVAKESADRHVAIGHLHTALTEKVSATHIEQMFQKLQADIRAEVARDAERIGELRHDVDAQRKTTDDLGREIGKLRERLSRNREVRIPAFTMRLEDGDDGVMTLVSQVGASD